MPLSPKTQMLMQPPPSPAEAEQAFEEGFTQMAQRIFESKYPELIEHVVTFKTLKVDMENNSGVGAFVLLQGDQEIFIPVVLADNQIKPIEMIYLKDKDIFLPLSKEWIAEVSSSSVPTLGNPMTPPKTLNPDMSIRDITIPPTEGRYAFAASKTAGVDLGNFLAQSPNFVKEAFKKVLEENRNILKFAYEKMDFEAIKAGLEPNNEKVAQAPADLTILGPEASPADFKRVFGDRVKKAYQTALGEGFVVSDNRPSTNTAIETERPVWIDEIQQSGFYRMQKTNGETVVALVVVNATDPEFNHLDSAKAPMGKAHGDIYKRTHSPDEKLDPAKPMSPEASTRTFDQMVVLPSMRVVMGHEQKPFYGERIYDESEIPKSFMKILGKGDRVKIGKRGFFVRIKDGRIQATRPFFVTASRTDSQGIRRISSGGGRWLCTDPNSPIGQIVHPTGGSVTYIPNDFTFIHIKDEVKEPDYIDFAEPKTLMLQHLATLEKTGAEKIKVIYNAADKSYTVKSASNPSSILGGDKVAATLCLLSTHNLREKDAASLVKKAHDKGTHSFYLVNPRQLEAFMGATKLAQMGSPIPQGMFAPEMLAQQQAQGMPMPQGAQGPMSAEMAMPPEAMLPAEPQGPSPVEIAVDELSAMLAEQATDVSEELAETQKDLSDKLQVLQAVKQRAAEISGSGAMPPVAGGAMPPVAGGAMPPVAGGAMPPVAGGAMPPEQIAAAVGQDLGPMVEPQGAGQEQILNPSTFEAAALSSLAANSNLGDSIADYAPTLEAALDKVGRLLLSLWLEESTIKEQMGDGNFGEVESQLISVFKSLGDLILKVTKSPLQKGE